MKKSIIMAVAIGFLFLCGNSFAEGDKYLKLQTTFKEYFNKMSVEVKDAETATEKREIISEHLNKMNNVLDKAEELTAETKEDREFLSAMRDGVNEKLAELEGKEGFERVADSNLNDFADYIQQDMELADTVLTISLTTALLIIIIILLIA